MLLPILQARDLKVIKDGRLVLDVPEFKINKGEVLSLIGPNGAGKTILILTLSSLLKPSLGEVFFNGRGLDSEKQGLKFRRNIAVVFQEPLLLNTTVFKNVALGLKLRGMEKKKVKDTVFKYLQMFGIEHLYSRKANNISGGEAQRASLARAFAIKPEILFLDEPFSSLDVPTKDSLINDLGYVLKHENTTAILSTHDRVEAIRLSERLAVMRDGKIVQTGTPEEVNNKPADEFVAGFVGVETILNAKVERISDGGFIADVSGEKIFAVGNAKENEKIILCIRPENVILSTDSDMSSTSLRNIFQASITKITALGPFYRVYLDCGFPLTSFVTSHSCEDMKLYEGKKVTASFKATSVHLIRI